MIKLSGWFSHSLKLTENTILPFNPSISIHINTQLFRLKLHSVIQSINMTAVSLVSLELSRTILLVFHTALFHFYRKISNFIHSTYQVHGCCVDLIDKNVLVWRVKHLVFFKCNRKMIPSDIVPIFLNNHCCKIPIIIYTNGCMLNINFTKLIGMVLCQR